MIDLPGTKRQDVYMATHLRDLVQVSLHDSEPWFMSTTKMVKRALRMEHAIKIPSAILMHS